ncbi:MAG: sensor domain-containing diguanylate cyclase [Thalassotalea sp.]|nr:sensor domain-containing diguanylate cyclase [Thalassotalea sp.]
MSDLAQLIENSRANQAIAQKLFTIETEILSCSSSKELLQTLLKLIKEQFSLTHVHLLLVEPTPISYMLSPVTQTQWHQENTRKISANRLALFHNKDNEHETEKPLLTNNLQQFGCLLPTNLFEGAQSAAFIPVKLENKLFGSLVLTDKSNERFTSKLGTFHLEQLAVKVSLCLSNVLVREQLEYMANYDRLTGVANRRLMETTFAKELSRQKRYSVPFSILFIDCNKFKQINDTYGHDCGDKVLAYVATQLQELIRETDQCFRYAGDEFVISLASQTKSDALKAAKRFTEFFVNNPMPYENQKLDITISCGVAESTGKESMDELLKLADEQLYLHKQEKITYR